MRTESLARWSKHVSDWRASGLSVSAYARREGLNEVTLGAWKRRLAQEDRPTFVELVQPRVSAGFRLEVGGVAVQVPQDFDPEALRRLLAVVGQR